MQAICEDYRAGAGIDREHDDADRGERTIECPLLALWGAPGALPRLYDDLLEVWLRVRPGHRRGIDAAGHFVVEDLPAVVAEDLLAFLAR